MTKRRREAEPDDEGARGEGAPTRPVRPPRPPAAYRTHIRPEHSDDALAIRDLLEHAFPTAAEARLVEALRGRAEPSIALIAEEGGRIVGHILFTPVDVRPAAEPGDASSWRAMALGPMAIVPDRQRSGVGSRLVEAGLAACRARGEGVVFVLGHPAYYPRFGFRPARPLGFTCKWPVPDDVFLVAELAEGALAGKPGGEVVYHGAFDAV